MVKLGTNLRNKFYLGNSRIRSIKLPKFSVTRKRVCVNSLRKLINYSKLHKYNRFDDTTQMPAGDIPLLLNQIALKFTNRRGVFALAHLLPLVVCVDEKIKEMIKEAEEKFQFVNL